MKNMYHSNRVNNCIKFGLPSEADCELFLRLTQSQFHHLSRKYNVSNLSLFVFYTKCGHIIGCSKTKCSNLFYEALNILYDKLVPNYLEEGFWDRRRVFDHTPKWVRKLLGIGQNNIVLILDDTNIIIEKPGDHEIQKLLYSDKKLTIIAWYSPWNCHRRWFSC